MGSILGNLTNPAVVSPQGQMQFFSGAPQAGMALARQAAQTAQPSTADIGASGPSYDNPQPQQPQMVRPSFLQAADSGPGGTPNAMSPGLSKAGKLAVLLTSGLKGALAGRAAQEQTIAATGGRRAGGIGTGFQAGYSQPFQEAEQRQQAQLGQAGLQPIPLPGGVTVPAAMAPKFLSPYLGYQGKIGSAQILGGAREQAAQTQAGATTQAAQIRGQASRDVANINQGQAIPVPSDIAHAIGMDELANVPAGRGTWTNINKNLEAQGLRVQDMGMNGTGPNEGMWLMDKLGNRRGQISPNSLTFQRGASFAQNRPEVVTDPNDPGYAYYTSAANAMRNNLPSPMGAATLAAKTEARSEVPTKVGDQKVAFNTAIQHAELFRQAIKALSNGDQQTLNSLKNKFSNEFGASGPITAQVIADAYGREVTSMLSKGHMTDSEIATVGNTVNPLRQSPQQIESVLGAYEALAKSKLNMLNQQAKAATAPKRAGLVAPPSKNTTDPLGIR